MMNDKYRRKFHDLKHSMKVCTQLTQLFAPFPSARVVGAVLHCTAYFSIHFYDVIILDIIIIRSTITGTSCAPYSFPCFCYLFSFFLLPFPFPSLSTLLHHEHYQPHHQHHHCIGAKRVGGGDAAEHNVGGPAEQEGPAASPAECLQREV